MLLIFTMLLFAILGSSSELEHFVEVTSHFQGRHSDGTEMISEAFPQADIDTASRECAKRCMELRYYCQEFAIVGDSPICQMSKWLHWAPSGPTTEAMYRVYRMKVISSGKQRDKSLMGRFTNEDVADLFHRYGLSSQNLQSHKTFLQVCKHAMSNGRLFTGGNLLTWRVTRPSTESEISLSDLRVSLSREIRRDLDGLIYYQIGIIGIRSYPKAILPFLEIFSHSVRTDINTKYYVDRNLLILDTQRERIVFAMLSNNLYGVLRGFKENPGKVEVCLPDLIPETELQELLNFYKTEPLETPFLYSVHYCMTDRNPTVSALRAINYVTSFLLNEEPAHIYFRTPEGVFYHDLVAAVVLKVLEREQSESEIYQTNILQRAKKGNFGDIDII